MLILGIYLCFFSNTFKFSLNLLKYNNLDIDKQHIALIILDVMMPKMEGYEFTEYLRNCQNNIAILIFTAKQLLEETCKGFLVDTYDYMVKSVNKEEILLRMRALLCHSQIINKHKLHIGKSL